MTKILIIIGIVFTIILAVAAKKGGWKGLLIALGIEVILVGVAYWGLISLGKKIVSSRGGNYDLVEIELDDNGYYESENGWKIKVPSGWEKIKGKGVNYEKFQPGDTPVGKSGWVYVAVEPFERVAEVDGGGFIEKFNGYFVGDGSENMMENSEYVVDPEKNVSGGYVSYQFIFDHDYQESRLRQYRKYVFPVSGGSGWLIYSQTRADEWGNFSSMIRMVVESFIP